MRDEALSQREGEDHDEHRHGLLDRALAGEADAWRELVARYLPAVYDFAAVTGGDTHTVAICEATFASALAHLGEAEPETLAPWLFGLAREAVLANGDADPGAGTLAALRGARALGPQRHTVLDLVVRQGLNDAALAVALGVQPASARLVRERVQRAAEVALEGAGGLAAYRRVAVGVPPGYLVDEIASRWAGPPARTSSAHPPAPFEPSADWVAPVAAPPPSRSRVMAGVLGAVAVLFGFALALPMSPIALTRNSGPQASVAIVTSTPGASAPSGVVTVPAGNQGAPTATPSLGDTVEGVTPGPSPTLTQFAVVATPTPATANTATPAPSPSLTPTETPTPTESPAATATPTQVTPTATPTATPTQCRRAIRSNLEPSNQLTIGASGTSSFVVLNSFCGPVEFSVSAGASWLSVSPAVGTLASGGSATVSVVAQTSEPGVHNGTITVSSADAGGFTIAVSYSVD